MCGWKINTAWHLHIPFQEVTHYLGESATNLAVRAKQLNFNLACPELIRGINVHQDMSPWMLGYQNRLIRFLFHDML